MTKPLMFAVACAVVAAVFTAWLLKPHVDRLSVTLGVGFSEGAPTPETTRFAADMERFLRPADRSAAIAMLVVLAGGLPLAVLALIAHHWPWLLGPLGRNPTVVWTFLTLQMTNVILPSFFVLLFASEGLDVEVLQAMGVAMLYAVPNAIAASVWRELLNRLHSSRHARRTSATT
jgi:hypothetical protein